MKKRHGESGVETVGVHVRLDEVVLAFTRDAAGVNIALTLADSPSRRGPAAQGG